MERPQWRATALAIAAAVLFGVSAPDANALALGRVTVQSALGEPLRAEIEIPEIDADEVASLRANIAAPDAFKAAGFEYNPALQGIRITLEKRADGRHFLRLTSQRPVNEPFIDLVLESTWASGRVVRDYTMLFDPPSLRQSQPLAAELTPSAPAARGTAASTSTPAPAARAPRAAAPAAAAQTPRAPAPEGAKQVTVKGGDTAGKIASANKPANVSLDQMLVALLRSNQDAFIGGNVNRLRSGAVLDMPSAEQAGSVTAEEAKQMLVAQSRDFNEFRRRVAESAPATRVTPADRQASGKITAQVEEKAPAAAAPDKLTLSKGSAQGKNGAAEEKIAKDRAAQDTASRVAELNKNIADLNKIGKGPAGPAPAASTAKGGVAIPAGAPTVVAAASAPRAPAVAAPSAPAAPVASANVAAPAAAVAAKPASASASAPAVAAATPAVAAASALPAAAASTPAIAAAAPASAAEPAASAAAPAVLAASSAASASEPAAVAKPAAKPAVKRPPPPPPEPELLDEVLDNWPLLAGGLGGIAALVGGFFFYRARQRKKTAAVDSSFLESRLQPDSFFGASGGQRIDTNEGGVSGSSLVYSPSQLDAAGDVDPVAEADVYLAYGRDLQAEEILKEAMRTQPQRVAIHVKLLEIYAKRRDSRGFELIATEAYGLTHGAGTEWERICELGQELDPTNSLYRGGEPAPAAPVAPVAAAATAPVSAMKTQPMAAAAAAQPEPEPAADIDLDLDFSLGDEPEAPAASTSALEQTLAMRAASPEPMPALDMDFGSSSSAPAPQPEPVHLDAPDLVLDENSLNFDLDVPATPAAAPVAAAPAPAADAGMLEFDLGGLSLDIDPPAKAAAPAPAQEPDTADAPISTAGAPLSTGGFEDTGDDPLATKLALAREFHSIGDPDGARSLAQEVLSEASGALKTAAQRFLAEIG